MEEFNDVMGAVKKLLAGAKNVRIEIGNSLPFVKVCEAFNLPINGGAISEGGEYRYFYID